MGTAWYHFQPAYKKAIADFYDGAFQEVDFVAQPDAAMKTINRWVSDTTREKIKDLIQRSHIDGSTRLILTNAIYFKGQWEKQFKEADTKDEDWQGADTRKVPMMHRKGGYLYYEGIGSEVWVGGGKRRKWAWQRRTARCRSFRRRP